MKYVLGALLTVISIGSTTFAQNKVNFDDAYRKAQKITRIENMVMQNLPILAAAPANVFASSLGGRGCESCSPQAYLISQFSSVYGTAGATYETTVQSIKQKSKLLCKMLGFKEAESSTIEWIPQSINAMVLTEVPHLFTENEIKATPEFIRVKPADNYERYTDGISIAIFKSVDCKD